VKSGRLQLHGEKRPSRGPTVGHREEFFMKSAHNFLRQAACLSLTVVVLLLWAIVAYGATQPQYGGILRIIDTAEGAQPIGCPWEVSGIDSKLMKPVIESLLREDVNGNYHPWLATAWKVDTAKNTITLSLRKGVKFHDGTDFNAEAVKWTIDHAIEAKQVKGFVSVDVVDDYTVRVNVERYQNNFLSLLASSQCNPVSPTAFEKKGKEWASWNPVGTGPFKFVKLERASKLTFSKFEGYWLKGRPYLDGIEYLFIRDPMTQQAAMRASGSEKVHVLSTTSGEQVAMLKTQGFDVLTMPVGPVSLIPDSNNGDSPLSKLKVRQAISYAINRDAIVKARGFGFWAPANQIPSQGQPGWVKNLDFGQYDPKKAKQLLAEAGYPSGLKLKLIVQPALVDRDAMIAVQRFLGEVGIQVELEFPDNGAYTAIKWKDGWHNGFVANHTRMLATFNLTYNYYWPTETGQFISMRRTDNLLKKLDASLRTPTAEDAKGQEMTRMTAGDAMFIPLYYMYEMYVVQPNVHDTGYCQWSAVTINTPETTWLSK
jgi:peptide/nickel transport system substrate-binding protein